MAGGSLSPAEPEDRLQKGRIEMPLYTIGFTKSSAEHFFERLKAAGVQAVLDVRLKNTSQLAGFARTPDIQYFLKNLVGAAYIHDPFLAPTDEILTAYKKKQIDWAEYEDRFAALMAQRKLDEYLKEKYPDAAEERYCLLCSEDTPGNCHRRLIAERMAALFGVEVVHL